MYPFSNSDHHLIGSNFFARGLRSDRSHKYVSCSKYPASIDDLDDKLSTVDWKSFARFDSVDESVECISHVILGIKDLLCPVRRFRVKKALPWSITPEARSLRHARDKAHRIAVSLNCPEAWTTYRRIRNTTNSMLRSLKSSYYADLFNSDNGKVKFWNNMSYLSRASPRNNAELPFSRNEINNYFCSIPHKLMSDSGNPFSQSTFVLKNKPPPFVFESVIESTVSMLICQMSSKKAIGHDDIPIKILKLFNAYLSSPITSIINQSLATYNFPSMWKAANVIPIEKKKGLTSLNNFRPISVLPTLSKLLERVVYNQFYDHLLSNDLLSDKQSGFRPNHSTQDLLL